MAFNEELKQLLKPYYWVNILLSISYVIAKRTGYICIFLFPESDCELDTRETEILFFLIIVVMLRTRKAGSVTMVNYLSSSFVYTKIANLILWLYADVRYGVPYGAVIILCALLLPEPTYAGPEYVTYFRGHQALEEELRRHKHTTWIVCLYAAWHPACVNFAPVFAELSHSYKLLNFRFGKLDIGRYPDAAAKYRIQDGPTSKQLPTVLLFNEGVEKMRRPQPDRTGKLQKFLFSKDNMKAAFDLDGILQECMERLDATKAKRAEKAENANKPVKKGNDSDEIELSEVDENIDKAEKDGITEKAEKDERTEKADKTEKAEKAERNVKSNKAEEEERAETAEKMKKEEKAEKIMSDEKPEDTEKDEKGEKGEKVKSDEKPEETEKAEKAEKEEKYEKTEKEMKDEKPEEVEINEKTEIAEKNEKTEKSEKEKKNETPEKDEKPEEAEKNEKMEKDEKTEKAEKLENAEKVEKAEKTD